MLLITRVLSVILFKGQLGRQSLGRMENFGNSVRRASSWLLLLWCRDLAWEALEI